MATTIFHNGRFFTATEISSRASSQSQGCSFANCMIVEGDIITCIGSPNDIAVQHAKDKGALLLDIHNKIVLPGFIDAHMHLLHLGQSLKKVNLEACESLLDIRAAIEAYAEAHPGAPRILCRGWMHPMTNRKALVSMIDDLDSRPIYIDSKDLHSVWCNSAAIRELGVESMPDPAGGTIHRDVSGKASGLLSEAAALTIVWPFIARTASIEARMAAIDTAIDAYSASGYTGIADMAMDEYAWEALVLLRQRKTLPIRIAAYWLISPSANEPGNLAQVERAIVLHRQFNAMSSPGFRIAGIKVILDGVIDACTAALCEPYFDGTSCDSLWTKEMLSPVVKLADEAGLQCALHAIGDGAIKVALDVLEQLGTIGRRHRIEHLELASAGDAKRLGRLGIIASIQPVHADPVILKAWPHLLGEERLRRAFAYREFLEGGATLALGSDTPTAPYAPLPNMYIATTRRSARQPELATTVNEHFTLPLVSAVTAATNGAAYSCFADSFTGRLEKGHKADFVVVDMEWSPEKLLQATVQQTWFEGRLVSNCS
jgi:predicted amidohydrolase YtcJ